MSVTRKIASQRPLISELHGLHILTQGPVREVLQWGLSNLSSAGSASNASNSNTCRGISLVFAVLAGEEQLVVRIIVVLLVLATLLLVALVVLLVLVVLLYQ